MSLSDNILSYNYWKNTKTFHNIQNKETQLKYYTNNNSSKEILQLVGLESKAFGATIEKLIIEIFTLKGRTSSQNDCTYKNKKIEIKAARYWAGTNDCKWQHIEEDYDYDYILFVLLDFNEIKIWGLKKEILLKDLYNKNIVTKQGKQGLWTNKSKITSYLTSIKNIDDLDKLITK
jgi:hypothetical protein